MNTYLPGSAHVAYQTKIGNGGCPSTHPVVLPLLFYEVLYWTIDIDQSAGGEFTFSQGDPTGYGFHGDFLNGWNQDVLKEAVENCLTLADNPDGTVSTCAALSPSDDVNFPRDCPEQPYFVPEPVSGLLDHLPGCNTPSTGPDSVTQVLCQVDTETPASNQLSSDAANPYTSTAGTYSLVTASTKFASTTSFDTAASSSTSGAYSLAIASANSTSTTSIEAVASSSISETSALSSSLDFTASTSPYGVYNSSSFSTISTLFPNTTTVAADTTGFFAAVATVSSTTDVATTPTSAPGVYNSTLTIYITLAAPFPSSTAAAVSNTTNLSASLLSSATPTYSGSYSTSYTTIYVTVSRTFNLSTTSTTPSFQNNTAIATNVGIPAQYNPTNSTASPSFTTTITSTTDSLATLINTATLTITEVLGYTTTTFTSTTTYPSLLPDHNGSIQHYVPYRDTNICGSHELCVPKIHHLFVFNSGLEVRKRIESQRLVQELTMKLESRLERDGIQDLYVYVGLPWPLHSLLTFF